MSRIPGTQHIQQPFTRKQALEMLRRTEGDIMVVIGLDWHDLRLPIDDLNIIVQHRIVADEFTLGWMEGVRYEPVGWDADREEVLVYVIADVDPAEWQEQTPYVKPTCKKCGSKVHKGYCENSTCSYSRWPQAVSLQDSEDKTITELEAKYGVKRRSNLTQGYCAGGDSSVNLPWALREAAAEDQNAARNMGYLED